MKFQLISRAEKMRRMERAERMTIRNHKMDVRSGIEESMQDRGVEEALGS